MGSEFSYFCIGLLGGALVDGMEFVQEIRANGGSIPDRYKRLGALLGEAVRLLCGGVLAWVFYASHQIDTPLAGLTIGIAAPIIIERLAKAPLE